MSTIKSLFMYIIAIVVVATAVQPPLHAIDQELLDFYASNDIVFYDADDCVAGSSDGAIVPGGGQKTAATTYGGSFKNGDWAPNNAVQGAPRKGLPAIDPAEVIRRYKNGERFNQGPNRYDDNGFGNDGKPLAGSMSFAELSKDPGANDFSALGKMKNGSKIRVFYKGKSIVVEKRDVGSGGPPYKGVKKTIDLWWEAAKVLDFKNGTDIVTWEKVPDSTPTTPVGGPAETSSAPPADGATSSQDAPITIGTDNTETILNFYASKGLSAQAAAGIAGNYWQESRHNPKTIQRFNGEASQRFADENYTMEKDRGFGLAQWTHPGRQAELAKFAKEKNKPIIDMVTQLEFSWKEMNSGVFKNKNLVEQLKEQKSATDPAYAAYIFHKIYEGSADNEETVKKKRGAVAVQMYEKYKDRISGSFASNSNPNCSQSKSSNVDTSKASFVTPDGFVVYQQCKEPFRSVSIKRDNGRVTTVCKSGCGAVSFAMAYTHLTGKAADMQQIADYVSQGRQMSKSGGYHSMSLVLAKKYASEGIRAKMMTGASTSQVSDALRSGAVVQAVGSGQPPLTRGGHFILIRGITPSGNWLFGNSAGGAKHIETNTKTEGYPPSRIHHSGLRNYIKIWRE